MKKRVYVICWPTKRLSGGCDMFKNEILNTPLECALRILIILSENRTDFFDIEKLGYYDYLCVNLRDYSESHISLHPQSPYRTGEILIKRPLVKTAIKVLVQKGLVNITYNSSGFGIAANEFSQYFLSQIQSEYALKFTESTKIASKLLDGKTNEDLRTFFETFSKNYDEKYMNESILRG